MNQKYNLIYVPKFEREFEEEKPIPSISINQKGQIFFSKAARDLFIQDHKCLKVLVDSSERVLAFQVTGKEKWYSVTFYGKAKSAGISGKAAVRRLGYLGVSFRSIPVTEYKTSYETFYVAKLEKKYVVPNLRTGRRKDKTEAVPG